MKILHVNNTDLMGRRFNGFDLLTDMRSRGIRSKQVVLHRRSDNPDVLPIYSGPVDDALQGALLKAETRHSMDNILFPWGRLLARMPEFLDADVVHYHLIHQGMISLLDLPMLFALKPSVWTLHDPWPLTGHCVHPLTCEGWLSGCHKCPSLESIFPMERDCADRMWEVKRRVLRQVDVDLVVASRFMMDMVRRSPITSHLDRVHTIPFGIESSRYLTDAQRADSRSRLGIPENDFVIMFRASDSGLKGLPYVIQALGSAPPDRRTTLVTVDQRNLVDELSGEYAIKEYGWVQDEALYVQLLSACDVLLMPSPAESFGLMALEAMAAGRPVICFANTAVEEVTHAPDCGVAVPLGNSRALREALDRLSADSTEAQRRGRLGRLIADSKYCKTRYLDALSALYADVAAGAGRGRTVNGEPSGPSCNMMKSQWPQEEFRTMRDSIPSQPCDDFDYSTPEAQKALAGISDLILEIREEHTGPIARKVMLYERTLGLAVIPVLIRRGIIVLARRLSQRR